MAGQTRYQHSGNAVQTTLASDITSGATTLTLSSSTGWPDGSVGPFWLKIDAGLAGEETMLATSRSGVTVSGITRGADSTGASAHTAGAVISAVFSATEADDDNAGVVGTIGLVTAVGDLIVGNGTRTMTKIAVGANGTIPVANSGASGGINWATIEATAQQRRFLVAMAKPNSTGVAQNNAVFTDLGNTTSITVPTWATKAYVRTVWQDVQLTQSGAIYKVQTVLNGVAGTVRGVDSTGAFGASSNEPPIWITYVDSWTGLTPGTYTLKTQAKGAGAAGSGATIGFAASDSGVEFDIEYLP